MTKESIRVKGARVHNLKNIDLDIPKGKLVVFTGVSGSGKSSLAFDTIYAEGQRRYVESLSSYARQFLGIMQKPDVDFIEGLSPAISIDQKTTSHNPRSTVGTVTEIYDYLRLLFARIGHPHCPICGREIQTQSLDQIVEQVLELIQSKKGYTKVLRLLILSPLVKDRKGEYSDLLDNLKKKGFKRVRIDGTVKDLDEELYLIKTNKHTIEAVVDRLSVNFKVDIKKRLTDSIEQALRLSEGLVNISFVKDKSFDFPDSPQQMQDHVFSEQFSCPVDNVSLSEIEPRSFSFNSPHGACPVCTGLGRILKVNEEAIFSDTLSITEGGILPFSNMFENDTWYSRLIKKVCEGVGIDITASTGSLTKQEREIVLYGTGGKEYKVYGTNRFGRQTYIWERFSGVVTELERRHKETESDYVRGEIERFMKDVVCEKCKGRRLKPEALGITIDGKSISDVTEMAIETAREWVISLTKGSNLIERERNISKEITKEIIVRLSFLQSVGLDYLTLARAAGTLAGGEAQRIRLASQIGSGLTGVLYVLDEPTVGLHPRDDQRLISTLKKLRDLGNSVIVVEHDREMIKEADWIVDFGPGAGKLGGQVVAEGSYNDFKKNPNSLTAKYLTGKLRVESLIPTNKEVNKSLTLSGCKQFNLKNITVELPLGKFIVVTGVSGSGKSTLIVETLYHAIVQRLNKFHNVTPGLFGEIKGVEYIDKVALIDQSPIGRTPRSNPATYTKVFDYIRKVFSEVKEARESGYTPGRFSFNVKGGRCEACEGQGHVKIEMQFMPDIWVLCETCQGKRYNHHTLEVTYKDKNISDVLGMNVLDAKSFFSNHQPIYSKLQTLEDVGLSYIELGQSATTLSGGEAQRVKLASELGKKATGSTLYILDEPTTGLHFADLQKLLTVLKILVGKGNTVVVIEHNLDIVKSADWIIDLGPEGGDRGGEIVATGRPTEIAKIKTSYTGRALSGTIMN